MVKQPAHLSPAPVLVCQNRPHPLLRPRTSQPPHALASAQSKNPEHRARCPAWAQQTRMQTPAPLLISRVQDTHDSSSHLNFLILKNKVPVKTSTSKGSGRK